MVGNVRRLENHRRCRPSRSMRCDASTTTKKFAINETLIGIKFTHYFRVEQAVTTATTMGKLASLPTTCTIPSCRKREEPNNDDDSMELLPTGKLVRPGLTETGEGRYGPRR